MTDLTIRQERAGDLDQIRQVNLEAFKGPAEAALVDALRSGDYLESSLVAVLDTRVVGHCALSHGRVADQPVLILAPVAVLPDFQGRGIGAQLIREALTSAGGSPVTVLGDPSYYGRFGFGDAQEFGVESPFPVEPGALQLLNGEGLRPGTVEYAPPFLVE